jgi:hypothetical protein
MPTVSAFTKEVDDFGIPRLPRARKRGQGYPDLRNELRNASNMLRNSLLRVRFCERWVSSRFSVNGYIPVLSSNNVSVDTALKILRDTQEKIDQDWQALIPALHALLQQIVATVPATFPSFRSPFDDPYTLIRYWTTSSHAPYVDELGFLCSGWASCSPLAQRSALDTEPAFQPEHLRDHCQMHIKPTYWISFTDDVSWLLQHYDGDSGLVSVVSIPKLDRLNIFWCRSDFLVEFYTTCGRYSKERNPSGIKFAYSKHYLVHGWVPTECIIVTYSQNQFP